MTVIDRERRWHPKHGVKCGSPDEACSCHQPSGDSRPHALACPCPACNADPALCDHANEVPTVCPCPSGCYCKAHTCRGTLGLGPPIPAPAPRRVSSAEANAGPAAAFGWRFGATLGSWSLACDDAQLFVARNRGMVRLVVRSKGGPDATIHLTPEQYALLGHLQSFGVLLSAFSHPSDARARPVAPDGADARAFGLPPGYLEALAHAEQTTEARRLYEAWAERPTSAGPPTAFDALEERDQARWRAAARASFEAQHAAVARDRAGRTGGG